MGFISGAVYIGIIGAIFIAALKSMLVDVLKEYEAYKKTLAEQNEDPTDSELLRQEIEYLKNKIDNMK